ncbi:hypothetical protein GR11A_00028 [Vibrio phage vB_VcorM_GR11A]|nr:hypothetical protein GR11A_00028 [Vibrio phage vB_VcorM_GR11A]
MLEEIQLGDSHTFSTVLFVTNEENLINSNCLYEVKDSNGVLYASGICNAPVVTALPSGETKLDVSAIVTVPQNLPIETSTEYHVVFTVKTPANVSYTNTTSFLVDTNTNVSDDDVIVELQGAPITITASFPHLAHSKPLLTSSDITVLEGGVATFTFNLSVASSEAVRFVYATRLVTADAAEVPFTSGEVTFNAGETTKTVDVTTVDDSVAAVNKRFTLDVLAIENAEAQKYSYLCEVIENDLPIVTTSDVNIHEDAGMATFDFQLNTPAVSPVVINYATQDGTAVAGTDYTAATGSVVIPTGSSTTQVHVVLTNDALQKGSRAFTLNVTEVSNNATRGTPSANCNIREDDYYVGFTQANYYAQGGNPLTFTVDFVETTGTGLSVEVALRDVSAFTGVDYTPPATLPIVVNQAAGAAQVSVNLATLARGVPANPRYVELTLQNPSGTIDERGLKVSTTLGTARAVIFD